MAALCVQHVFPFGGVEWNWGDPGCEGLLGVCDNSMVDWKKLEL